MRIPRLQPGDYPPFYTPYVEAVPASAEVLLTLEAQEPEIRGIYGGLSETQSLYRYAEGKWSLKELLGHLADSERVFSYRAMCIGRGESKPLPGFDENAYVASARFDAMPMDQLLDLFLDARQAALSLFRSMPEEAWARVGNANGVQVPARCFPYFCAGHAVHHLKMIRERYLPGLR